MQGRDERNVAARYRLEEGVAVERKRQPLRAAGLPVLRGPAQIEPGAEIVAMAEDDAAFRLLAGAINGFAQLLRHRRIEAVALVGAVEADERDLALELVGDRLLLAHELLLIPCVTPSGRRPSRSDVAVQQRSRTVTTAASPA